MDRFAACAGQTCCSGQAWPRAPAQECGAVVTTTLDAWVRGLPTGPNVVAMPTVLVDANLNETRARVVGVLIAAGDVIAVEHGNRFVLHKRVPTGWVEAATFADVQRLVGARCVGYAPNKAGENLPRVIPRDVIRMLTSAADDAITNTKGESLRIVAQIVTRPDYDRPRDAWVYEGFTASTRSMVALDDLGRECERILERQGYDRHDAEIAIGELGLVCEGAAWASGGDRAAYLATMVAAATRSIWACDTVEFGHASPGLVVSTAVGGSGNGKTTLVSTLATVAGTRNPNFTEQKDAQETMRTLGGQIAQRRSVINVTESRTIGDHWTDLLTGGTLPERVYQSNAIRHNPMRSVVTFSGIEIEFGGVGHARRRVIFARLDGPPNAAAGLDARGGLSPEVFAQSHEAKLWVACQTIVVAYLRAGEPDVECLPALASFDRWDLVRRAVIWSGGGDALASREGGDMDARDAGLANGEELIEFVLEAMERRGKDRIKAFDLGRGAPTAKAFSLRLRQSRFGDRDGDRRIVASKDRNKTCLYTVEIRRAGQWSPARFEPEIEPVEPVEPDPWAQRGVDLIQQLPGEPLPD